MQTQGQYSQPFIFFVTYESAQKDRVLHYTREESFAREKHSRLLELLTSYEENKVLLIWPMKHNLQTKYDTAMMIRQIAANW